MILTTAFACRYKNKLCVIHLRMCHREHESLQPSPDIRSVQVNRHDELGSPVMLFVFVATVGWAFQKPIGFTLVVIGQLAQIPLRRAVPFALRIKQPCQFQ
jgi:hypothetical protein